MKTEIRAENEMKDSGIDTVEKMPLSWNKIRLKNLVKIRTGNEDTKNATPNGKYRFYVRSPIVERCDRYTFEGEAILVAGDGAGAGRIFHLVNGKYAVHQRVYCLSEFKYNAKFIHYFLESLFPFEMDKGSAQSTVPSMRLPMLLNFNLVLPGENECLKIVDYLDEVCSKIDEIIVEAKASIEEYKELKQAVIFEAVTKGLYKNVEVKETGEKWLNKIPKHWRMEKGKKLLFETNYRSVDGQEELLTVSQYTGITPRSKKNVTMFQAESLVDYKICEVGDIAANTMWMWAGAVGVSRYRGIISPSYNTYRQKRNDYNSDYLDYLLRIAPLVDEYASLSTGIRASRLRLYPTKFLSINYPVPPLVEQMAIVDWLNEQLPKYDSLITEKEALIADLEAYKKSLIYELVTGKRRVV